MNCLYRVVGVAALLLIMAAAAAAIPTISLSEGDTLVYEVDFSANMGGEGIEATNMRIYGTVSITILNITEDYITMRVVPDLSIEGVPLDYPDLGSDINQVQTITVPTYGILAPFENGGPSMTDILETLQEQLQALGFNETEVYVSEVIYNGVPAIKVEISLSATNYLGTGSEVGAQAVSYLDMSILALLYGEATAYYTSTLGNFEYSYKIELTNPEVLQQSLAGYEVEVEGGDKVNMVFAAEGLSVSEPDVAHDRVRFTVSGEGIGSIIIKAGPGAPEPSVYIDGSPAYKYRITTAADGTRYYKVPIKFSQHEVEVVFGRPVVRATAINLNLPSAGTGSLLSGPYMTLIIALIIAAIGVAAAVAVKVARKRGAEASPAAAPEAPAESPPSPPPPPST